jgi:hypothetical protein
MVMKIVTVSMVGRRVVSTRARMFPMPQTLQLIVYPNFFVAFCLASVIIDNNRDLAPLYLLIFEGRTPSTLELCLQ